MTHNEVAKSEWGHLLPVYLSGRAQASFSQVGDDTLDDYELVKETMLESLGDTPASADRRWWTINHHTGEAPGAFYLRVRSTGLHRLHGLRSRDEVVERTILSRYLSLLSQECYSFVFAKGPKDGVEAARLVQEFEETRGFARRHQPWRNTSAGQHNQSSNRGPNDHGYKRAPANGEQQVVLVLVAIVIVQAVETVRVGILGLLILRRMLAVVRLVEVGVVGPSGKARIVGSQ